MFVFFKKVSLFVLLCIRHTIFVCGMRISVIPSEPAVSAEKMLVGDTVLPKFYDVCQNHDLPALDGYEKKFCLKFRMKTKKRSSSQTLIIFLNLVTLSYKSSSNFLDAAQKILIYPNF